MNSSSSQLGVLCVLGTLLGAFILTLTLWGPRSVRLSLHLGQILSPGPTAERVELGPEERFWCSFSLPRSTGAVCGEIEQDFLFFFQFILFIYFTLQYCIGFAIH